MNATLHVRLHQSIVNTWLDATSLALFYFVYKESSVLLRSMNLAIAIHIIRSTACFIWKQLVKSWHYLIYVLTYRPRERRYTIRS